METNVEKVKEYALDNAIDFAVIGPEAPLEVGIVDALEASGVPCVGAKKEAAMIETSKAFMRLLIGKYEIPAIIKYGVFNEIGDAEAFIECVGSVAVKPVGLTGGKGVKLSGEQLNTSGDAVAYAKEILDNKIGGVSQVVIEEKVNGEEFTLQVFCDGKTIAPMPLVQDHKRAYENDMGPNTGGMGSYSDADHLLPFLSKKDRDEAVAILQRIVDALRKEGKEYKGILYGQFILTADGPKVIECNARFGDPEAMNVLSLLDSTDYDFVEICTGIINGDLKKERIRFDKKATVCKYVVPEGYGKQSIVGKKIIVDEAALNSEGALIYYASVNEKNGALITTSSRSLGVVGVADTIEDAEIICENGLKCVQSKHIFIRHDIGKKTLIEKRIAHMNALRNNSNHK
jgi:phosphoribosylamine--glycine ligase